MADQPGGADQHTDGRSVVVGGLQLAAAAAAVASGVSGMTLASRGEGDRLGRTRCAVSMTEQVRVCSPVHTPL